MHVDCTHNIAWVKLEPVSRTEVREPRVRPDSAPVDEPRQEDQEQRQDTLVPGVSHPDDG